jgi:protocatechuate 3,4-dioxygenase beta subunit
MEPLYDEEHSMELHDDDKPVGRILSRREILTLLGGAGAALIVGGGFRQSNASQLLATEAATSAGTGAALPACIVRPALTEGPYFVDEQLERTDIRVEPADGTVRAGMLLNLIFNVFDVSANSCTPLPGAQVDVWHCDALGNYSSVNDPRFQTEGEKWLRGYQITDKVGAAKFVTIYPGWYSGRTVHIHFKIRTDPAADTGYEFTSQLFFDEAISNKVFNKPPYASKGRQDTTNATDGIFQGSDGLLTLDVKEELDGNYTGTFGIGLDLSQPAPSSGNGGGPGGPPPAGGPGGRGTPPATGPANANG